MNPVTIAMDGAAWSAPFILRRTRAKFVEEELKSKIIFAGKPEHVRREMLEQIYTLAEKTKPVKSGKRS